MMSTIPNFIAFWRPAIYQNNDTNPHKRLEPDQGAIYVRMAIMTTAVAALVLRSISHSHHAPLLKFSSFKMIFAIATIAFMYSWNKFEHFWATWKLDHLAIKIFKQYDSLPWDVQKYLETHLSAVQRLTSEVDFNKHAYKVTLGNEYSLLGDIIRTGFCVDSNSEKATCFEIFKLLIDHGVSIKTADFNYFLYAIEKDVRHFAIYALETDKIKQEDLTPDEQISCWIHLRDDCEAQALIKNRFSINVKNIQQLTPLLWTILHASPQCTNYPKTRRINFLLANGASLPDYSMLISVEKQEIPLIHYLKTYQSPIIRLLKQASDYRKQPVSHQSYSSLRASYPSTFAPWKPAIAISISDDEIFCTFDVGYQLKERTCIVAFAVFAALATAAMKALMPLAYALPLIALPYLYYKMEWYRAIKTLDDLALQEYQTMFPPHKVLKYIVQRESLIDQLIAKKITLTKIDRAGYSFFSILDSGYDLSDLNFDRRLALVQKLALHCYGKEFTDEQLNKSFPKLMKLRGKQ